MNEKKYNNNNRVNNNKMAVGTISPSLTDKVPLFQLSQAEKEEAKAVLKSWVAGFSRNSGGQTLYPRKIPKRGTFPWSATVSSPPGAPSKTHPGEDSHGYSWRRVRCPGHQSGKYGGHRR